MGRRKRAVINRLWGILGHPVIRWPVYWILDILFWMIGGTRFTETGVDHVTDAHSDAKGVVFIANHCKILYLVAYLKYSYARAHGEEAKILVVLHGNGCEAQFLSKYIVERIGCSSIQRHRSSVRKPVDDLTYFLRNGKDVFMTLEQRGKHGEVDIKTGAAYIAGAVGSAAIIPVQCWPHKCRILVLPTWDGLQLPICPRKVYIKFGPPITTLSKARATREETALTTHEELQRMEDSLAKRGT